MLPPGVRNAYAVVISYACDHVSFEKAVFSDQKVHELNVLKINIYGKTKNLSRKIFSSRMRQFSDIQRNTLPPFSG
jgi:hypothetical protein